MHIFTLEHNNTAYRVDFALYCAIVMVLAVFLMVNRPREQRVEITAFVLAGLISWAAIEYALHRFVLHGLQPFRRWHEEHHRRPMALIFTPMILSTALIVILILIPALLVVGLWSAFALTFGVLTGYLPYTITHHAVHLWYAGNAWLKKCKLWHALHHHHIEQSDYYGVTSSFLDHVFGSTQQADIPKSIDRGHNVY
jgi:cyclopropane-fatty-acyl-phospholipid synthase